jgi:hypothetical protein
MAKRKRKVTKKSVKASAVNITREFENGEMVVNRNGVEVSRVTSEELQTRIDRMDTRLTSIQSRKTEVEDWKAQAEASA